jgi:hypothetical protein
VEVKMIYFDGYYFEFLRIQYGKNIIIILEEYGEHDVAKLITAEWAFRKRRALFLLQARGSRSVGCRSALGAIK